MSRSDIDGSLAIMDMHHLVATPDGVEHFVERHEMGLFSHDEYLAAFEATGVAATHDAYGLFGRDCISARDRKCSSIGQSLGWSFGTSGREGHGKDGAGELARQAVHVDDVEQLAAEEGALASPPELLEPDLAIGRLAGQVEAVGVSMTLWSPSAVKA